MQKLDAIVIDKLIQKVRENPMIYATNHEDYKKFDKKKKIWQDISKSIGVDNFVVCQQAWKSLRDQFTKSVKDQQTAVEKGEALSDRRTYKYYESLSFLVEHVATKSKTNKQTPNVVAAANNNEPPAPLNIEPTQIEIVFPAQPQQQQQQQQHTYILEAPTTTTAEATTSNQGRGKKRSATQLDVDEQECFRSLMTELLKKLTKEEDRTDSFFLVLAKTVKDCNLSNAEFIALQCSLMTFLNIELQKMGKLCAPK